MKIPALAIQQQANGGGGKHMIENGTIHARDTNQAVPEDQIARAFAIVATFDPTEDDIAAFERLLLQHPSLIRTQSHLPSYPDVATTLLYTAARAGNLAFVRLLIDKGADPNYCVENASRSGPMHVACYRGHVACVRKMLSSRHFEYNTKRTNAYGEDCRCVDPSLGAEVEREVLDAVDGGPASAAGDDEPPAVALPVVWWDEASVAITRDAPLAAGATIIMDSVVSEEGLHPSLCAQTCVADNGDGSKTKLVKYQCAWYFLGDDGMWEPLQPAVASRLACSLEQSEDSTCIVEVRHPGGFVAAAVPGSGLHAANAVGVGGPWSSCTYAVDAKRLTSQNCDTKRVRPLLHIGADGLGVFGADMPVQWTLVLHSSSAKNKRIYEALPLSTCESINEALRGMVEHGIGTKDVSIPFSEIHNRATKSVLRGRGDLTITLMTGGSETSFNARLAMKASANSPWQDVIVVKFTPTVFQVNSHGLLEPLCPGDMRALELALVTRHHFMRDERFEYDLMRHVRTRIESGEFARLVFMRPAHLGATCGICGICDFSSECMPMHKRLLALLGTTEEASDPCPSPSSVMRTLRNKFRCTLVGRAVADVVVHATANVRRIDVELPREVHEQTLPHWMKGVEDELSAQHCTWAEHWSFQHPIDPLTREPVKNGVIAWTLQEPPTVIYMIPPWHTAQHPPSSVDFSVNNLRIEPGWSGVGQSVPIGVTTRALALQLLERRTIPVYDVEWFPDLEGGYQCHVRADIPYTRQQAMKNALRQIQLEGYTLIRLEGGDD